MHFPFFRITFRGKTSHILGSCHIVELSRLPNSVFEQVLNKNTLIIESGINQKKFVDNWKEIISENPYRMEYNNMDNHINNLQYLNNLYKKNKTDNKFNEFNEFKKMFKRKWYNINILKYTKSYKLNRFIEDVINSNFYFSQIFKNIDDVNFKFISNNIYSSLHSKGMDHELMFLYLQKYKNIHILDNNNRFDTKNLYEKMEKMYYDKFNIALLIIFLDSIIEDKNIYYVLDKLYNDLKYDSNNYLDDFYKYKKTITNKKSDKYILYRRNEICSKKFIKFHEEIYNPLFVVGVAHLVNQYSLFDYIKKELKNENIDIEIWDVKNERFNLYRDFLI